MSEPPAHQRRGRRIAMSATELDDFLAGERTCRVATLGRSGPHLSALWFVWDGASLWLYSLTDSKRWNDVACDPRVAVLVDAGVAYDELRGVELRGRAEAVGEIPRTATPDTALEQAERLFAQKYLGGGEMIHDGKHAWLRCTPDYVRSWDFRKLATLS